ncbi:MAG: hypothetical protein FJX73_06950 [Armatimonadetes bacterium]|nr:hypothetical protein [Armatimonadota bacterium]
MTSDPARTPPAEAPSGTPTPILTPREVRALERVGDIVAPACGPLPAFSATGCVRYADDLLRYMPPEDVADIRLLLRILSIKPTSGIRFILALARAGRRLPGSLGATLRMIEIGLKGLVMSLYYSGKAAPGDAAAGNARRATADVADLIGYRPRVVPVSGLNPPSPPPSG